MFNKLFNTNKDDVKIDLNECLLNMVGGHIINPIQELCNKLYEVTPPEHIKTQLQQMQQTYEELQNILKQGLCEVTPEELDTCLQALKDCSK